MQIDGIINSILGNKKNREKYFAALLKARWPDIVGKIVAAKSLPAKIDNGILFLQAGGSVWAHNLLTMKQQLLAKINDYPVFHVSKIKITDLKITSVPQIKKFLPKDQEKEEVILPDLTNEDIIKIHQTVAFMSDKLLSGKMAGILIKDKKLKKYCLEKIGLKCEKCGAILSYRQKRCVVCEKDFALKRKALLARLFFDTPWLEYSQAQQDTDCSRLEFFSARAECRQKFLLRALAKDANNSDITRYVMIKTGCPVFLLTEDLVDKIMKEARRSNHVPALGLRRYGTGK